MLWPSAWGWVKTPLKLLNSGGTSRQSLIDYFAKQIDPADFKRYVEEGERIGNQGLHDTVGGVTVKTDFKPLDTDANAAYLGGTVTGNQDNGDHNIVACVFAMTIVKDRAFLVYLFRPYKDARDVVELLAGVKKVTARFIAANGG